jgi:hypothetical protein
MKSLSCKSQETETVRSCSESDNDIPMKLWENCQMNRRDDLRPPAVLSQYVCMTCTHAYVLCRQGLCVYYAFIVWDV